MTPVADADVRLILVAYDAGTEPHLPVVRDVDACGQTSLVAGKKGSQVRHPKPEPRCGRFAFSVADPFFRHRWNPKSYVLVNHQRCATSVCSGQKYLDIRQHSLGNGGISTAASWLERFAVAITDGNFLARDKTAHITRQWPDPAMVNLRSGIPWRTCRSAT
jgi:hypothetical protein